MLNIFFARLKSLHRRLKRDASGVNAKYALLLGIRIVYAILGKGIVYRCYYTLRYFSREDLLLWYLFYWILVGGMLLKLRFSRFSQKQTPGRFR